jgi:hypothetical protein
MTPNESTAGRPASGQVLDLTRALEGYKAGEISADEIKDYIRKVEPTLAKEGPSKELLWKEYELKVNNYERLLELTLKTNALYYVATGAVLSFYFNNNPPSMRYALLFPVLASLLLIPLFGFGADLLKVYREHMRKLTAELEFTVAPEFNVLAALLTSSAFLFFVVASGLLYLLNEKRFWLGAFLVEALVCVFFRSLFRKQKKG